MSEYLPIQPAPPGQRLANRAWLKKNRPVVAQACEGCRRLKCKCDGARPECRPCIARGRNCNYADPNPKSSRLESLELLFKTLRTSSPEGAASLVRQIQASDGDLSTVLTKPSSRSSDAMEFSADVNGKSGEGSGTRAAKSFPLTDTSARSVSDLGSKTLLDIGPHVPKDFQDSGSDPVTEAKSIPHRDDYHGHAWIPEAEVARHTVECFFASSGKLFHIFSRDQIARCYDIIYGKQGTPSTLEREAALCSLLSLASVGAQYIADSSAREIEKPLYNSARRYLDTIIERLPMTAIKVCTLLAMHNIMDKTTVALSYVEIGLSICRRNGLYCKTCQLPGMSPAEWLDYRRAWRALLFFSSWLSSTLGYISGNDILSTGLANLNSAIDTPSDISDIVQNELVRIAFLKAHMLRVHLAFKEFTALTIESVMRDLQEWYRMLPKELHLSNLGDEGLPLEAKRSLCHVHLLYLGAIMLLYRRIAAQFALPFRAAKERMIFWKPFQDVLVRYSNEAITSAEHSSRILVLLMEDEGVFKRCWLVIFQAYTTCLILLHSVVQKLVHELPVASLEEELEQCRGCLSVLSFCGSADRVAQRLHDSLISIFELLLEKVARISSIPTHGSTSNVTISVLGANKPATLGEGTYGLREPGTSTENNTMSEVPYLLCLPNNADPELGRLSESLLSFLCRPFGDPTETQSSAEGQVFNP